MKRPIPRIVSAAAFLGLLSVSGCDRPIPPQTRQESQQQPVVTTPVRSPAAKEKQMAFLNRIRDADPKGQTIQRALLNEENELGLILGRGVEMKSIPDLMRGMLTQMAKEFPGEDLTVVAYAPSNPPRKIGTAHLDSKTRDMTYKPAG